MSTLPKISRPVTRIHLFFLFGRINFSKVNSGIPFRNTIRLSKSLEIVKDLGPKWFANVEACIGVLGIQDICQFTSRDIGYYPYYFQEYGILCSIFSLLSGILNI